MKKLTEEEFRIKEKHDLDWNREYRKKNKKKINKRIREWKRRKKELLPPKIKKTEAEKREHRLAYMKEYNRLNWKFYEDNPVKNKEIEEKIQLRKVADRLRYPKEKKRRLAYSKKYQLDNHEKYLKYQKEYRSLEKNKEKYQKAARWRSIKTKYGITEEQFNSKILEQNNCCKICGRIFTGLRQKEKPMIDHNHTTGKVRDILCQSCNLGMGNFNDSVELMEKAIQYLKDNS